MDGFSEATALAGRLAQNSSLSAASWGPGRWDVFGTFADGKLAHWWNDPDSGPGGPESLGEGVVPAGGLSVTAWEPGILDVFGVGSDRILQHWSYRGEDPFARESLGGGQMAVLADSQDARPWGGPSAVWPGFSPDPEERLGPPHVYAISADGSLLRWILSNPDQPETLPSLKPLAPLGGLSAISWVQGRVDVFAAAADGTLQHWWADDANWNQLQMGELGGTLEHSPPPRLPLRPSPVTASPLCAVSWAPGYLDVFGVGLDQTLLHWWCRPDATTESGSWCGGTGVPESLKGRVTGPPVAASTRNVPGSLDVFAPGTGTGGAPMLQYWWYRFDPVTSSFRWNNGSPEPQAYFGAPKQQTAGPPVACVSTAPNTLDVFSCNTLGELMWWHSA